jgi:hypothetical protein
VDQATGLVAGFQDQENYDITRANALENNVRLYGGVQGDRKQFAGANVKVSAGDWHRLKLAVQGTLERVLMKWTRLFSERLRRARMVAVLRATIHSGEATPMAQPMSVCRTPGSKWYTAVRDAYLQRRQRPIQEGVRQSSSALSGEPGRHTAGASDARKPASR